MDEKIPTRIGPKDEKFVLCCDSQSSIHMSKNPTLALSTLNQHSFSVRYHWIGDVLEMKLLQLEKIHTNYNGPNMVTKVCRKKN